ncbi:MAG: cytochrome ubiquinol oxidase subunit I [Alloprevotella sp.]
MNELLFLSRFQFALTACYHWLFVPLTLGLGIVMSVMETLYVRSGDSFWKRTAQFWQKLFGINFAVGVATGIILEFEFGTNWSNYSWFVGDIFGAPLAIEGILAFFMEATFIALMFFGWEKLSRRAHLASTWLTVLGATISAWWILVANSWMQHPVGMEFNPETVRNEMLDFFAVAFSPTAVIKFAHTVLSGWMTGAVFVIAVSCWFLLKRRNVDMAKRSIKVAAIVGLIGSLGCMGAGDASGVDIAKTQPMKLAAAEGLEQGSNAAPFSIVPGVEIPHMLSILATHDFNGFVPGINDITQSGYTSQQGETVKSGAEKIAEGKLALKAFNDYRQLRKTDPAAAEKALEEFNAHKSYFGYGYLSSPENLVPNVPVVYWAFRLMIGLGSFVVLIFLLALWLGYKQQLERFKLFHYAALLALPCVYIAGQCGWIVAEVGRQPWAIQGLLPVNAGVSSLSSGHVVATTCIFAVIFTALLVAEIRIMLRAIREYQA